jgi:serine/threonine protein kinase
VCVGEVSLGLRTLHGLKVIHRDVKLDNIYITESGSFRLGFIIIIIINMFFFFDVNNNN